MTRNFEFCTVKCSSQCIRGFLRQVGCCFQDRDLVGLGFGALLIALRVSPYLPPSSLRGLDLGPSLCLDFWHFSSCIPCPILALHLLPLIHLLQITGLLLTCMSEGVNLAFTIRQAILTLRHLADSLESALEQIGRAHV